MKWNFAALLVLLLSAANRTEAQSATDRGRALFQEKGCPQCHSYAGVGGKKGPALDAVGKRLKKVELKSKIMNGSLIMPAFQEALSPDELRDIVQFLHSSTKIIVPAIER